MEYFRNREREGGYVFSMYVKDWMDVCNVYRTQSFKMRTHNEVTKEARIKLDYWTCYWFHLFGTPSLFCQFFSSHSPYFLFFLSSFFLFFFFFSTNKTRSSRPCSLYYIDSMRDHRTYFETWNCILLDSTIFHDISREIQWPHPNFILCTEYSV